MRRLLLQQLMSTPVTIPAVILEHYQELGLTVEEFIVFLHFSNGAPNLQQVAHHLKVSDLEMLEILQKLVNKQLVREEPITLADGKIDIRYSFEPLYQKAVTLLMQQEQMTKRVNTPSTYSFDQLIELFEQEWGRALTPMQLTMINDWIKKDEYSPDLIVAALKEAVLANVRHLNYIRSILENWRQRHITTVQEAEQEAQKFRKQKVTPVYEETDVSLLDDETISWFR